MSRTHNTSIAKSRLGPPRFGRRENDPPGPVVTRAGLSDRAIGREFEISDKAVFYHRKRLGLKANHVSAYTGKPRPCGERLPDHLRPRLRLLLLALKKRPDGKAWMHCWQYFRRLEGRPDAPAWGDRP